MSEELIETFNEFCERTTHIISKTILLCDNVSPEKVERKDFHEICRSKAFLISSESVIKFEMSFIKDLIDKGITSVETNIENFRTLATDVIMYTLSVNNCISEDVLYDTCIEN